MILDERNEFADATSVVASTGTALVGDVIDLGATTSDIGNGEDLFLVIQTDTEIITGGSTGSIQFKLSSDDTSTIAVDGSATDHLISPAYVTDDAAANSAALNAGGTILAAKLPPGTYERYLGILCVIGSQNVTAGKINAFLTKDFAKWAPTADAVN